MYEYRTRGVCASEIFFDVKDGKVYNVRFENGCDGNLKALGSLVEGLPAGELTAKLKGIRCGHKDTSCADQLARAVEAAAAQSQAAS